MSYPSHLHAVPAVARDLDCPSWCTDPHTGDADPTEVVHWGDAVALELPPHRDLSDVQVKAEMYAGDRDGMLRCPAVSLLMGDLATDLGPDDLDQLADAFETFADDLRAMIPELVAATEDRERSAR